MRVRETRHCLSNITVFSLDYSEALARMPRWKKILFSFLCISTCCCFGGGCCCLCGCACCCNFCCNHCCGKYKHDEDPTSSFEVSSEEGMNNGGTTLVCLFRKKKIYLVCAPIVMSTGMDQVSSLCLQKRPIQYSELLMMRPDMQCLPRTKQQRPPISN
jgi:hypothetical protein